MKCLKYREVWADAKHPWAYKYVPEIYLIGEPKEVKENISEFVEYEICSQHEWSDKFRDVEYEIVSAPPEQLLKFIKDAKNRIKYEQNLIDRCVGRVIHIKDAPKDWKNDDDYVYIGRPSKWGNPFKIGEIYAGGKANRERVCALYRQWIVEQPQYQDIKELLGKTLVCYCKPKECHGDVLLHLLWSLV